MLKALLAGRRAKEKNIEKSDQGGCNLPFQLGKMHTLWLNVHTLWVITLVDLQHRAVVLARGG